jgi:hypothetical protein
VEKGAERAAEPEALRIAASSLIADKVVSLKGKDLGGPEALVVEVSTDAKTKRITCGPADKGTRRCTVTGVDAVFEVREASLAPFLGAKATSSELHVDGGAEGGALARDGGPR